MRTEEWIGQNFVLTSPQYQVKVQLSQIYPVCVYHYVDVLVFAYGYITLPSISYE